MIKIKKKVVTKTNQLILNNNKYTKYLVICSISISHMFNDMIQSLILAIYPILQSTFHLGFVQIGVITLTYQLTASLLQPLIGYFIDNNPQPFSLFIGMGFVLCGVLLLSVSNIFPFILLSFKMSLKRKNTIDLVHSP